MHSKMNGMNRILKLAAIPVFSRPASRSCYAPGLRRARARAGVVCRATSRDDGHRIDWLINVTHVFNIDPLRHHVRLDGARRRSSTTRTTRPSTTTASSQALR